MTLANVQDVFASLVTGERAVDPAACEAYLLGNSELSAADRAHIYSDMYLARLVDALREDYPLLARLLGDEGFFTLGAEYARAHPSHNPSLAHLGRQLPAFVRARPRSRPDLADLAALEWARAEAFIAPDAEPVGASALQELAGRLPAARLELIPSVRLLSLEHDVVPLWAELEASAQPGPARHGSAALLVWRTGFDVFHAAIVSEELAALTAVQGGMPLGQAFEAFAAVPDPAQAALDALSSWFGEGLIAKIAPV